MANPEWTDPIDWEDEEDKPPKCDTCDDTGEVTDFVRFSGEAVAGEPVSRPCPDCSD